MTTNSTAGPKKIRTEYMKKFRDPKWETFTKCYQDSLRYRITRRLMEQTHRPLFEDGWDGASDSSGKSSPGPRLRAAAAGASSSESRYDSNAADVPADPGPLPVENGYRDAPENGPGVKRMHRAPRPEPGFPRREPDTDDSTDAAPRNPGRARSQPPVSAEPRDWTEGSLGVRERRRPNMRGSVSAGEIHRADVGVQTRRDSEKRGKALERRRARSADLEKSRRGAGLTPVKDCWITEYMRCFSARLR
ncbi:centriole, cilia and spindle-associated protein [Trichomycterus rosablanca]|uniref:centriole, cilia and spindle-associated protein n=1 Tax=Trichomycterus rosablanca TaxID=2290929 RepID=UPI002F3535A0